MLVILFAPLILFQVALLFVVLGFAKLFKRTSLARHTWMQLVMLDRYANTLLGGSARETISARMGRLLSKDRCVLCKWTCKFLDLFEKDHCLKSIERDK